MKCLRCNTRNATSGALCEPCRDDLRNLTKMQREAADAKAIAQAKAIQVAPQARKRTEWIEAV